jgi:phospholipase/carboxylesterase
MSNFLPSSRWSADFNPLWRRDAGQSWVDGPSTATIEWNLDDIPTAQQLAEGYTGGPTISLVDEPHAIALPETYEPGYAYPLIVWLHSDGGSEEELFEVLPQISDRNYLGVAIRGNLSLEEGAHWSTAAAGAAPLAELIDQAVENLSRQLSFHRERVYLVGVGGGGSTALELLLEHPDRYAGAACLCGEFPALEHPLVNFRGLHGRRTLLATALDCAEVKIADLIAAGRLLYMAGVQVGTRVYQQGGDRPSGKMLRDLDHWIMDGIASAAKSATR